MEDEIFGPILPIITYNNIDEIIVQIKLKPKPLACYIFSNNNAFIKKIENITSKDLKGYHALFHFASTGAKNFYKNNISLNKKLIEYLGKNYFSNCYIEGTTDFIFGDATVLFENCEIHSKKDSYITAASTPQGVSFGYVFKGCKLTADEGVSQVYLGRPWRIYAKTVFMNCEMGKHIQPQGWENWSKPEAEKTAFYAEYNCTGLGFQPQKRVSWSRQLTKIDSEKYTTEAILGKDFLRQIETFKLN